MFHGQVLTPVNLVLLSRPMLGGNALGLKKNGRKVVLGLSKVGMVTVGFMQSLHGLRTGESSRMY